MGFYYDETGTRRSKTLGTVAELTKTKAHEQLDNLVRPVNEQRGSARATFANFVNNIVLPAKRRQWKDSTRQTTEERIARILIPEFKDEPLTKITRATLQDFLDKLATNGTSWSVVAHTRWDLSMVMKFAHNEGLINRNPAALLHIPDAPTKERHVLTLDQARLLFSSFPVRERLILKLCGLAGLRPGETFGLKWSDISDKGLRISRRVYRGVIDTPKSKKGNRIAALSKSIISDLKEWQGLSPNTTPDDWIFASENPATPIQPTNALHDKILPILKKIDLAWVNYQVLRRSAASLMNQLGIEGKTVAEQLGHGLDVSQNIYTQAGIEQQTNAVNRLDDALNTSAAAAADETPNGIFRNHDRKRLKD